jgi:hypothetical protein
VARYILECPQCLEKAELRRHVPGKRVLCRKCRAVLVVPEAPGQPPVAPWGEPPPLSPELRAKVVKVLSLRRLGMVALVMTLILIGAALALIRKRESGSAPAPPPEPEPRMTLARLAETNRLLALPLGKGFTWEYTLSGGGTEVRRVALLSRGLEDEPVADVGITGPVEAVRQTLRAASDGVYLVSETRGEARYSFSPPLRLVPHPLYLEDSWKYRGARVREGGAAEEWALDFQVAARPETVDSGMGRQTCFRVEVKGSRGSRRADDVLWYAKGVGLVKRRILVEARAEEALLMRFDSK